MKGGLNQIILFGLGFQILASVKEKSFSLLASFIIWQKNCQSGPKYAFKKLKVNN